MQLLMLCTIVAVLGVEYLVSIDLLPHLASYAPEILGIATLAVVVSVGAWTRFRNVRPAYWLAFGAMLAVMASGVLINEVSPGPLFTGLRTYLRAIPMFLLPAIVAFSDRQIRSQMLLILGFSLIQLPIALKQRLSSGDPHCVGITGDCTVGTLLNPAILSVFQICVVCLLTAIYLRKRVSGLAYMASLLIILIPTAISETKGTLVLLPVGLFAVFLVGSRSGGRVGGGVRAVAVLAVFMTVFVPIYDYFMVPRYGYGLVEFVTREGRVEGYLYKKSSVGSEKAGRVDAIVVPLQELARDPAHLAFGLGIGNATDSALGENFVGDYFRRFEPFLVTTSATMLLETGVLGVLVLMGLYLLILQDSLVLARTDRSIFGMLGVGWVGVVAVMTIATFYKATIGFASLSYLFWYFSGVVAARRVRLVLEAKDADARGRLSPDDDDSVAGLSPKRPRLRVLNARRHSP